MDTLIIGGKTFTGVTGIKATDDNSTVQTFTKGGGGGNSWEDAITPVLDGKTHLWFMVLDDGDKTIQFSLERSDIEIDWGDGVKSTPSSGTKITHTYQNGGIYDVSFDSKLQPWGNTAYVDYAYRGKLFAVEMQNNITADYILSEAWSVKSIYIADGCIEAKGSYMCANNYGLTQVRIDSESTTIPESAFDYCHSLGQVAIPSAVTSIGNYAFRYCRSLKEVAIPSAVTSIGNNAFQFTPSLMNVHVLATNPPTLGTNAFMTKTGFKIFVPANSLSAYQSATNWSTYASYMQEEPQ